jgi:electron transfer flavoprotein alpha subunit
VTVLCLVEHDAEGITDASRRALCFAHSLAGSSAAVCAVLVAPLAPAAAPALAAAGAAHGIVVSSDRLGAYAPMGWARSLEELVETEAAVAVVAASTDRGSEVMAHLGVSTDLPVVANCVSVAAGDAGALAIRRQRWGGSLLEDCELRARVALLTTPTDLAVAAPAPLGEPVVLRTHEPELRDEDLAVAVTESTPRRGGVSLAEARVVVGGGRGVGGPEGFSVIEELAGLLGGAVGVSRVVTSQGWRPHREQVGQTGTRISPDLYLACGISGAIQHMAGCLSAKHLVAINTDPDAPIMSRAGYALIGDLHEILPAVVAALRERRRAGPA